MEGLTEECHSSLISKDIKAGLCLGWLMLLLPPPRLPDGTEYSHRQQLSFARLQTFKTNSGETENQGYPEIYELFQMRLWCRDVGTARMRLMLI